MTLIVRGMLTVHSTNSAASLRCRWVIAVCLNAVLFSIFAMASLAAPPQGESKAVIQDLVAKLSSDHFTDRVAAQQQLFQLAEQNPEQLALAYEVADSESQARILQLLEGVFLNCADERGDRAELALEVIGEFGSTVAQGILIGNARLRESRAREAIERLGGQLTYVHPAHETMAISPLTGVGFGEPAVLKTILIPEDWRGTPEDLWHFRRFSHHQNLKLFNIRGSNVDSEDLWPLAASLSGLQVEERGACLGIQATPGATTAEVFKVVENSAAEAAGLKASDQIEMVDELRVRNFSHLVEVLTQYRPGDQVTLQIRRDGETLKIPVKLASWKNIMRSELPAIDAPSSFPGPLGMTTPPPPKPPEPVPQYQLHNNEFNLN